MCEERGIEIERRVYMRTPKSRRRQPVNGEEIKLGLDRGSIFGTRGRMNDFLCPSDCYPRESRYQYKYRNTRNISLVSVHFVHSFPEIYKLRFWLKKNEVPAEWTLNLAGTSTHHQRIPRIDEASRRRSDVEEPHEASFGPFYG
jgi:hypothetical protein